MGTLRNFSLFLRSAAVVVALVASASAQVSSDNELELASSAAVTSHPWIAPATPPATSSATPAPPDDDEGWQVSVAPYAFLSALDGELRAGDRAVEVDRSFGEITDVLKFAAGIRLEAQHEKFGFAFDNNYMKLGDDVTTDRGLVPDFRFDLTLNVTEIEPRYRLWSSGDQDEPVGGPELAVDVIGGVRLVHLETDLLIRRAIAADEQRTGSATYVHGYLGNRFIWSPSEHFSFESRYNIALASDFSWFINANVDVRPWEHFSIGGGLQILDLSLENDSNDSALDARLFGPVVFMKFHF